MPDVLVRRPRLGLASPGSGWGGLREPEQPGVFTSADGTVGSGYDVAGRRAARSRRAARLDREI